MTINGINYYWTKHARLRFWERRRPGATQNEILLESVKDPKAVWKPHRSGQGFALVTIKP